MKENKNTQFALNALVPHLESRACDLCGGRDNPKQVIITDIHSVHPIHPDCFTLWQLLDRPRLPIALSFSPADLEFLQLDGPKAIPWERWQELIEQAREAVNLLGSFHSIIRVLRERQV